MSNAPTLILGLVLALAGLFVACGEDRGRSDSQEAAAGSAQPTSPEPPRKSPRVSVDASLDPILEALREPDPFARVQRLSALLPTLDGAVASLLPSLLRNPRLDLGAVESALLLRFWSRHDAEAAAHWALSKSPTSHRPAAIEVALKQWAAESPQGAVEDLAGFSIVPGPFVRDAQIALVRGWSESGKPGLVDYIQGIGPGYARQRAVAIYAMSLVRRDGSAAAMAWAESIPDDDPVFKKDALRQTGSSVAIMDPLAAAAWCDRLCDDPLATNLRAMVAQRWAEQDGPPAMDWVSRAPAGQERDWAVRSAFWGWWHRDPEGFERWMEAFAGDDGVPTWLEYAVEPYAAQLAKEQPEEGLRWAGRIGHDKTRERSLTNVARFWRRNDPAAADAWLEQSPLSEEARERVRNPKPGGRQPVEPVELEQEH
jgi:hypothetical protein